RAKLQEIIETTDYASMGPLNASRGRLDRALARYRLGENDEALRSATPAVVQAAVPPNQAQAWFIQALANVGLEKFDAANNALAQGEEVLNQRETATHSDFLEDCFDWQIAEMLRAEAAQLLSISDSAKTPDATAKP